MKLRRMTISIDKELHRIIQKMRGHILGETGLEISFAEATTRLIHKAIIKNSKLTKDQRLFFLFETGYINYPDEEELIQKAEEQFFKEELPRIIDKMIEQKKK
ncbi:MAG: hypothetical protein ACFFDI_29465 [Promethearchaeota archaeon]